MAYKRIRVHDLLQPSWPSSDGSLEVPVLTEADVMKTCRYSDNRLAAVNVPFASHGIVQKRQGLHIPARHRHLSPSSRNQLSAKTHQIPACWHHPGYTHSGKAAFYTRGRRFNSRKAEIDRSISAALATTWA